METAALRTKSPAAEDCASETVKNALKRAIQGDPSALPLLPKVAHQVMTMSSGNESDASELSRLIHSDQALACHIMRVANSVAYRRGPKIVSLQQALTRLGMSTLAEIALLASLQGGAFRAQGYAALATSFQKHAFATANYAKEIARMQRKNLETAFLCGLMHQIGKIIVLHLISGLKRRRGALSMQNAEIEALTDAYHVDAGVAVANHWRLPDPVIATITMYRDIRDAPADGTPSSQRSPVEYLNAIQISAYATFLSALVFEAGMPSSGTSVENTPHFVDKLIAGANSHPLVSALNLYPDDIEKLIAYRETIYSIVSSVGFS